MVIHLERVLDRWGRGLAGRGFAGLRLAGVGWAWVAERGLPSGATDFLAVGGCLSKYLFQVRITALVESSRSSLECRSIIRPTDLRRLETPSELWSGYGARYSGGQ